MTSTPLRLHRKDVSDKEVDTESVTESPMLVVIVSLDALIVAVTE